MAAPPVALCSQPVHSLVCYGTFGIWTQYFETSKPILLQIVTTGQWSLTINFGGQEVKEGQGHTRLKINLKAASFSTLVS